ncbi:acyltransferase [Photobacterium damselae]|uniref:acyltransferase n=1 Tax=Photobacterium damselae TaxID=38293 RepID=UPI0012AD7CC5|nr:hypothetical protein [Photobacterium damselae]
MLNKLLTFIVCLIIPSCRIKIFFLNFLGHKVHYSSYIGFSIFWGPVLVLEKKSSLHSLNMFYFDGLLKLNESSTVYRFNIFIGSFNFYLDREAVIANFNKFKNSGLSVIECQKDLMLGFNSKITSNHYFDLSDNITIGSNCVIGGRDSQFWTHGFIHSNLGLERYINLSPISIGDGCYFGSRVLINPGCNIDKNVNVLGGSVLSGNVKSNIVVGSSPKVIIYDFNKVPLSKIYDIDYDFKCGNPRIKRKKI